MSTAAELLESRDFLTGGGTETYLLFQQGFPLREFCAFEIFENDEELAKLEEQYLNPVMAAAAANGAGLLLDALIWRASPDYVELLGYPPGDLVRLNRAAVARTKEATERWLRANSVDAEQVPILIAADIGPRGDGYKCPEDEIKPRDSRDYHSQQLEILAGSDADVIIGLTLTSINEAIGLLQAAEATGLPAVISPTVETDGRLPDGSSLAEFIERVDEATSGAAVYYMVNCAHPSHLVPNLEQARERGEPWLSRFKGFRANASRLSHEELDNSTELDRGDPIELASDVAAMKRRFDLRVVGGCCGTDHEHIKLIAEATSKH